MYKTHIYEAADGWRWHTKAGNGKIVADSGEAYSTKANAKRAWRRFRREAFRIILVED